MRKYLLLVALVGYSGLLVSCGTNKFFGCENSDPIDVSITLSVDAEQLFMDNTVKSKSRDVLDFCKIEDSWGSVATQRGKIKRFKTCGFIDKNVEWNAVNSGSASGYTVSIEQVEYRKRLGTVNAFKQKIVGSTNGVVTGRIKNEAKLNNRNYRYALWFSITNSSGDKKIYIIDPKIPLKLGSTTIIGTEEPN